MDRKGEESRGIISVFVAPFTKKGLHFQSSITTFMHHHP